MVTLVTVGARRQTLYKALIIYSLVYFTGFFKELFFLRFFYTTKACIHADGGEWVNTRRLYDMVGNIIFVIFLTTFLCFN